MKIENVTEKDNLVAEIGDEKLVESEKPMSWRDSLAVVAKIIRQVKPKEIVRVAGKLSDVESMILLKYLLNKLLSNNIWCEGNTKNTNAYLRSGYLLNSRIQLRLEADMVNVIIRKTVRGSQAKIAKRVPGKTVKDVLVYYEALVCEVIEIELGRVELPSYADDVDEKEDDGEKNVVVKKKIGMKSMASWGGEPRTSQKNEKSKKGTP
ncbi:hypothetical protein Tco_1148777 [Tanacetum coccineum]